MSTDPLRGLYGRLKVIEALLESETVDHEVVKAYDSILMEIMAITGDDLFSLRGGSSGLFMGEEMGQPVFLCRSDRVRDKLSQLLTFLRVRYGLSDDADRLAAIHEYITDADLRDQCDDILIGNGNFDRAITQATLVLEDRIRTKSKLGRKTVGVRLVDQAMNPDISRSVLKLSANADEHKGFCNIFRGIVQAYRNPSHHHLSEDFSRMDALRFCGFVDNLLSVIDEAEIQASQ